jgi:hypothetical protein
MKTITAQDMAQLIHNIADKTPTFIYPLNPSNNEELCLYKWPTGEPACLIGHVLAELGLLDFAVEGRAADTVLGIINNNDTGYTFTEGAADIAMEAQRIQDMGQTWEAAASSALQMAEDTIYWTIDTKEQG